MPNQMRKLGNTTLQIAPLVFGGNVFGWTVDEKMSLDLLDAFLANGFNCIDTADIYSVWVNGHQGGESETMIGHWLAKRKNRDKVVIATKVGMEMGSKKKGLSQTHIFESVENSLKRLQTDYIDLYQAHIDDPNTPLEETLNAFTQLQQQGKVKFIGASNYSAERLEQALQVSKKNGLASFQSLQPLYNLYDRKVYEAALEAVCKQHHLGVITYFSLASGFLTGKYQTEADVLQSSRIDAIKKYFNPRGLKIIKALKQIADELHATPAQVALAWLISHPSVTAPIASATNLNQLHDLLKATRLKLTTDAINLLNRASAE